MLAKSTLYKSLNAGAMKNVKPGISSGRCTFNQRRGNVETNPVVKFFANPTRGQAIKAKCAECVGCTVERIEPGFRATIRDCASNDCPLWKFRPFQRKPATQ